MSKKKNQHYVPQSYLRLFSYDKKNIGVYISAKDIITIGTIKHQASGDYFYSENLDIENRFKDIEDLGIESFKRIITCDKYEWELIEYLNAYVFIIIQYARTLVSAKSFEENSQEILINMLKAKTGLKEIDPHLKFHFERPVLWSINTYSSLLSSCLDLKYKILLIDKERVNERFITSDNPACMFNPLFTACKIKDSEGISLGSKGLIIFITITPLHAILIYDADTYKIGNRKGRVTIRNDKDVSILNKLVVINSNEVLFYKQDMPISSEIKDFAYDIKNCRRKIPNILTINQDCSLSFVRILSKAKALIGQKEISSRMLYRDFTLQLIEKPDFKEYLDEKWGTATLEERKLFYQELRNNHH